MGSQLSSSAWIREKIATPRLEASHMQTMFTLQTFHCSPLWICYVSQNFPLVHFHQLGICTVQVSFKYYSPLEVTTQFDLMTGVTSFFSSNQV